MDLNSSKDKQKTPLGGSTEMDSYNLFVSFLNIKKWYESQKNNIQLIRFCFVWVGDGVSGVGGVEYYYFFILTIVGPPYFPDTVSLLK